LKQPFRSQKAKNLSGLKKLAKNQNNCYSVSCIIFMLHDFYYIPTFEAAIPTAAPRIIYILSFHHTSHPNNAELNFYIKKAFFPESSGDYSVKVASTVEEARH